MWFVTKIEKIELTNGWDYVNTGQQMMCGYFKSKEQAKIALSKEEARDYNNVWYDYVVLEKFGEGFCPVAQEEIWFKYDAFRGGYFEIETPECMRDFSSWGFSSND